MNDQYIEFDKVNSEEAVDYIFTELVEEKIVTTKEDIRLVLRLFWEYVAQHHMTVEVDLDWEGEEG